MKSNVIIKIREGLLSKQFTSFHVVFQYIAMLAWMSILTYSRAYYIIYLIIGIIGFLCRKSLRQDERAIFSRGERLNVIVAALFSLVIVVANYDIPSSAIESITASLKYPWQFDKLSENKSILSFFLTFVVLPVLFLGGIYVIYYILSYVTKKLTAFEWSENQHRYKPKMVFLSVFIVLSGFFSTFMLLCYYPGISSGDSRHQLMQVLSDSYSNHHPFYHTMLIKVFVTIGRGVFGSLNAGVSLYNLFSIMLLSAAFAYSVVTAYQLKINRTITVGMTLFYMLLPINIFYSFTVWKDVPFAAVTLALTVSVFRYLQHIGRNEWLNLAVSIISGVGMCLLRSNGMFAYALVLVLYLLWFRKQSRKMTISLICVLAFSLILKYPVLSALHVGQSEPVESLSIPLQQVARTVVDHDDLDENDKRLISKVMGIQEIKDRYDPVISDPIKFYIRDTGGQAYYLAHKSEYLKLYLRLGIKHPGSYTAAWIDQTRGYWNAGYYYWRFTFTSSTDEIGTQRIMLCKPLHQALYGYTKLFEYTDLFKPFVSIGLYTWLIWLTAFIGFRKKDRITVFATVPCMAILLSLMIATPVFAELRYAYALFCCLPFFIAIAFRKKTNDADASQRSIAPAVERGGK